MAWWDYHQAIKSSDVATQHEVDHQVVTKKLSSRSEGALTKSLYSKSYLSDILSMVFGDDGDPSVKAGQSSDNIRAEVDTSDDNDAIAAPVDRINRPKRDYFYGALVSAIGE